MEDFNELKDRIKDMTVEEIKEGLKLCFLAIELKLQEEKTPELSSLAMSLRYTALGREVSRMIQQEQRKKILAEMEKTKEERIKEAKAKEEEALILEKEEETPEAPEDLVSDDQEEEPEEIQEETPEEVLEEVNTSVKETVLKELQAMTSKDLKTLAAAKGIKNSSKMRKADLIEALKELY